LKDLSLRCVRRGGFPALVEWITGTSTENQRINLGRMAANEELPHCWYFSPFITVITQYLYISRIRAMLRWQCEEYCWSFLGSG
jgi:hypothetical protein